MLELRKVWAFLNSCKAGGFGWLIVIMVMLVALGTVAWASCLQGKEGNPCGLWGFLFSSSSFFLTTSEDAEESEKVEPEIKPITFYTLVSRSFLTEFWRGRQLVTPPEFWRRNTSKIFLCKRQCCKVVRATVMEVNCWALSDSTIRSFLTLGKLLSFPCLVFLLYTMGDIKKSLHLWLLCVKNVMI